MTAMKYLIAFGFGFLLSTALTFHEYALVEKYVSDYCGALQSER